MKYIHCVFIVFVSLIIFSCKQSNPCKDNLLIFEAQDSIPRINIENGDTRDIIISKFQEKFGEDLCYKKVEFGLQLSEKKTPFLFTLSCPIPIFRIPRSSELNLLINQQKKVLINSETIVNLDALEHWIAEEFQINKDSTLHKKEIAILWNASMHAEDLELVTIEIIKGIKARFDLISIKKFNKSFCLLSSEEAVELIELFPYKLVLNLGYPPPPPPTLEQSTLEN